MTIFADHPELAAFLTRIEAAQERFADGDAAAFKALWAHGPEVTLSGGLGGQIEKGWEAVSARLDRASASYADGQRSWERIGGGASGDMAYVVLREVIEARIAGGGRTGRTRQELRVTMVLRRAPQGWRIVHRHADAQMEPL